MKCSWCEKELGSIFLQCDDKQYCQNCTLYCDTCYAVFPFTGDEVHSVISTMIDGKQIVVGWNCEVLNVQYDRTNKVKEYIENKYKLASWWRGINIKWGGSKYYIIINIAKDTKLPLFSSIKDGISIVTEYK